MGYEKYCGNSEIEHIGTNILISTYFSKYNVFFKSNYEYRFCLLYLRSLV